MLSAITSFINTEAASGIVNVALFGFSDSFGVGTEASTLTSSAILHASSVMLIGAMTSLIGCDCKAQEDDLLTESSASFLLLEMSPVA